jgi:hypothetical protein
LLLPTIRVAFDGLSVRNRLANGIDKAHSTFTVVSYFSLARCINLTIAGGMAQLLATMLAVLERLATGCAATFLHECFSIWEALSYFVANFWTIVPAREN